METLKKYWYIVLGLVFFLYIFMKKKTTRRRRRNRSRMPMRSYFMRRRTRR